MNLKLFLLSVLSLLLGYGVFAQRGAYLGDDKFIYKLPVSQDVTLERGDRNYNYLQFLIIALHPGYPLKRSLVQFESPPSDCGCKILGARMFLYFDYAHKASFYSEDRCPYVEHEAEVYMVRSSWDEASATSTYRRSRHKWNKSYLALDGTDAYPDVLDRVSLYPGAPNDRWVEFEVTEAVKKWASGGYANNGLLIKVKDEGTEGRDLRFYSSAYSNSNYHPYISVLCEETTGCGGDGGDGGRPIPIDEDCGGPHPC